jgi:hypothetical protein
MPPVEGERKDRRFGQSEGPARVSSRISSQFCRPDEASEARLVMNECAWHLINEAAFQPRRAGPKSSKLAYSNTSVRDATVRQIADGRWWSQPPGKGACRRRRRSRGQRCWSGRIRLSQVPDYSARRGPEPSSQRQLGVMHDGSGGGRSLAATAGAFECPGLGLQLPGFATTAARANKPPQANSKILRCSDSRSGGEENTVLRKYSTVAMKPQSSELSTDAYRQNVLRVGGSGGC